MDTNKKIILSFQPDEYEQITRLAELSSYETDIFCKMIILLFTSNNSHFIKTKTTTAAPKENLTALEYEKLVESF